MVHPRRAARRFGFCGLFTALLLTVSVTVLNVAQASITEPSRLEIAPDVAVAPHAALATDSTQWRAVRAEAPPCEFSALEPETDGEPAGPDAASIIQLAFGRTAAVASSSQLLQAASGTYIVRFAASPVLARAPP